MLVQWYFPQREKSTRLGISVPAEDPPSPPWAGTEMPNRQAKSIQDRHGLGQICPAARLRVCRVDLGWAGGARPPGQEPAGSAAPFHPSPHGVVGRVLGLDRDTRPAGNIRSLFQRVLHIMASFSLDCSQNCALRNISVLRNSRDKNIVLTNKPIDKRRT